MEYAFVHLGLPEATYEHVGICNPRETELCRRINVLADSLVDLHNGSSTLA